MKRILMAAAVPAVVVAVAGCGSSAKTSARSTPAAAGAGYGGGQTLTVAVKKAAFGRVLAGANGRTLYLFLADQHGKSSCSGACAALWPPLTGSIQGGAGINAALLGTTARADGTKQVTYGGNPLYYYAKDKDSGDAYGEGIKSFGAEWYAVGANAKRVEKTGS